MYIKSCQIIVMSVYFHVNFNLNRERLAGVLSQLIENPDLKLHLQNDINLGLKNVE